MSDTSDCPTQWPISDVGLQCGSGLTLTLQLRGHLYTIGTYGGACPFSIHPAAVSHVFDPRKRDMLAVGEALRGLDLAATAVMSAELLDLPARALRECAFMTIQVLQSWFDIGTDASLRPLPAQHGRSPLRAIAANVAHAFHRATVHIRILENRELVRHGWHLKKRHVRASAGPSYPYTCIVPRAHRPTGTARFVKKYRRHSPATVVCAVLHRCDELL